MDEILKEAVVNAMKEIHDRKRGESKNKELWYNDALINSSLRIGIEKGWILRTSITQVEWTDKGAEEIF